jgi:hypothetical protein
LVSGTGSVTEPEPHPEQDPYQELDPYSEPDPYPETDPYGVLTYELMPICSPTIYCIANPWKLESPNCDFVSISKWNVLFEQKEKHFRFEIVQPFGIKKKQFVLFEFKFYLQEINYFSIQMFYLKIKIK